MMRQTGGFSMGETSTRSKPASRAMRRASRVGDDADLFILIVDEADGGDANLFVATQTVLANGGSSCFGK